MPARVLVVDDEEDVRVLLRSLFTHEGWVTSEAADGFEAIEACSRENPDLIVLDNMMPGLAGMDVARQLRDAGHDLPIVMFSGYLSPELSAEAEALSLWSCSKVDLSRLVAIIRHLLNPDEN